MHAVVIDRKSGAIAEGLNGKVRSTIPQPKIHPTISQRINDMYIPAPDGYPSYDKKGNLNENRRRYPMKDSPVRHAEIKAINTLLNADPNARMSDLRIDTVFILKDTEGKRDLCPCCANCTRLTYGAPARAGKNAQQSKDPRYNRDFPEPAVPDWIPDGRR